MSNRSVVLPKPRVVTTLEECIDWYTQITTAYGEGTKKACRPKGLSAMIELIPLADTCGAKNKAVQKMYTEYKNFLTNVLENLSEKEQRQLSVTLSDITKHGRKKTRATVLLPLVRATSVMPLHLAAQSFCCAEDAGLPHTVPKNVNLYIGDTITNTDASVD